MNKKNIVLSILIMIAVILGIAVINNIVGTKKLLDKIIYDAKVEAEETLISTGKMTYTKDIENNNAGEGNVISREFT